MSEDVQTARGHEAHVTRRVQSDRAAINILHTTSRLGVWGGGVGAAAVGLAEAQSGRGEKIAVACADAGGTPRNSHYQIHEFGYSGPRLMMHSPRAIRFAKSGRAAEYELLHQHGIWEVWSHVTNTWRRKHRRPTIVAPHGSLEPWAYRKSRVKKNLALWAYERENLMQATCLQVTTAEEVAGLRSLGLRNPIALIPNGVADDWLDTSGDAERFRRTYGIEGGRRIMMLLSRLNPVKGVLELIQAYAAERAHLAEWDIVFAGCEEDPAYARQVRSAIAAANLQQRVHFVGTLDAAGKRDGLAASDLFVLPTYGDSFGIAVAEALGVAVPVLTTTAAIAWQCLETEACGWRVPIGVLPLARKLRHIASLPSAELAEMGVRGAALVRERFLWSYAAEQSLEVYRWMLGERSPPDCISF